MTKAPEKKCDGANDKQATEDTVSDWIVITDADLKEEKQRDRQARQHRSNHHQAETLPSNQTQPPPQVSVQKNQEAQSGDQPEAHPDAYPDAHLDAHLDAHPDAQPGAHSDVRVDTHPDPQADTQVNTHSQAASATQETLVQTIDTSSYHFSPLNSPFMQSGLRMYERRESHSAFNRP